MGNVEDVVYILMVRFGVGPVMRVFAEAYHTIGLMNNDRGITELANVLTDISHGEKYRYIRIKE